MPRENVTDREAEQDREAAVFTLLSIEFNSKWKGTEMIFEALLECAIVIIVH